MCISRCYLVWYMLWWNGGMIHCICIPVYGYYGSDLSGNCLIYIVSNGLFMSLIPISGVLLINYTILIQYYVERILCISIFFSLFLSTVSSNRLLIYTMARMRTCSTKCVNGLRAVVYVAMLPWWPEKNGRISSSFRDYYGTFEWRTHYLSWNVAISG